MIKVDRQGRDPARRPARRRRLRRPGRGGLTGTMPYGPHTADDRERMLAALGLDDVDQLFADIPTELRATSLDLPEPEPELELAARLRAMAGAQPDRPRRPSSAPACTATGARRPSTSCSSAASGTRPTRRTSPRSARGRSRSIYEYESLLAELVDLDVVSASHYDGAAATAEAALMTCRATRRERVLISRGVHPHYRATTQTYFGAGLELEEIPLVAEGEAAGTTDLDALERMLADTDRPVAGVIAANPDFLGLLEPMPRIGRAGARRGRAVRRGHRAGVPRRPRPTRRVRRGHRRRRGPAARHRAAVRRPVPRHPRLDRRARPPDPRAASSA